MKITLTGPSAFIALFIISGFIYFQYNARNKTLETEAIEELKTWLIAEYTRNALPQLQEMVLNPSGKEEQIGQIVRQISHDSVKIVSIEARGKGEDIAVKAEIEVDGKDPPDGKRIRYFRMQYSMLTGWQYEYEIGKWRYYLIF